MSVPPIGSGGGIPGKDNPSLSPITPKSSEDEGTDEERENLLPDSPASQSNPASAAAKRGTSSEVHTASHPGLKGIYAFAYNPEEDIIDETDTFQYGLTSLPNLGTLPSQASYFAAYPYGIGIGVVQSTIYGNTSFNAYAAIQEKEKKLVGLAAESPQAVELSNEITSLKEQGRDALGLFVLSVLDNAASASALGIEISGTTAQTAVQASLGLWGVSWGAAVIFSAYQLRENYNRGKELDETLTKVTHLYKGLQESQEKENSEISSGLIETLEDICILKDQNISSQREKLVVSNIQNATVLAGSLAGLVDTVLIALGILGAVGLSVVGLGAIIAVAVGVTVGLSYYLYKNAKMHYNEFRQHLAAALGDFKTAAKFQDEVRRISVLGKFDATSSLIQQELKKARAELDAQKTPKEGLDQGAVTTSSPDAGLDSKIVELRDKRIPRLEESAKMSTEARLNRLTNNLMTVLQKAKTNKDVKQKVIDTMVALGIDQKEIDWENLQGTREKILKALIA